MSTSERLEELVGDGRLQEWSSSLQAVRARKRRFLVKPDLALRLDQDPWPKSGFEGSANAMDRRIRTHTIINQFVEGQSLTVGIGRDDSDLKCLQPMERVPTWRIWEFRPWQEKRTTRVLGAFAERDVFVAIEFVARSSIRDWNRLAGTVDSEWIKLFGAERPLEWQSAPNHREVGSNFSYV